MSKTTLKCNSCGKEKVIENLGVHHNTGGWAIDEYNGTRCIECLDNEFAPYDEGKKEDK